MDFRTEMLKLAGKAGLTNQYEELINKKDMAWSRLDELMEMHKNSKSFEEAESIFEEMDKVNSEVSELIEKRFRFENKLIEMERLRLNEETKEMIRGF